MREAKRTREVEPSDLDVRVMGEREAKRWAAIAPYPNAYTDAEHARALDRIAVAVENVDASEIGGDS